MKYLQNSTSLVKDLFLILLCGVCVCATADPVSKIAFGSCANQDKDQAIWRAVNKVKPEVFVFLGDNIYGDTNDPKVLQEKYSRLGAQPGFQELRSYATVIATWDDHDFGANDAGSEYEIKHDSRKLMLDFWGEADNSPRRIQDGGIYTSYYFGEEDQRVQILLLDLRWNRTPLSKVGKLEWVKRNANNQGPYKPIDKENAIFLGETQWRWLEAELRKPAKVRIVASSLQMLSEDTGWEAWSNFPKELERFYTLVKRLKVEGLFIISGDTHWAEISTVEEGLPYPLYDITSSGLTETWSKISPNTNRISKAISEPNFGMIEIAWENSEIKITIHGLNGVLMQKTMNMAELTFLENKHHQQVQDN